MLTRYSFLEPCPFLAPHRRQFPDAQFTSTREECLATCYNDAVELHFEWDDDKSRTNEAKHAVSFSEAATAFGDPLSVLIPDPLHSETEERFVLLGISQSQRLLVVVHAEREETIRIISARLATARERKNYEEG